MKKNILIPMLLSTFLIAKSQQDSILKSKKGKVILPEKHTCALGISGNSFFNYLGNLFSNSGNNRLNLDLVGNNTLYGKYFVSKRNAIRMRFYLNLNSANYENKIPYDLDPSGREIVTDKLDQMSTNYTIASGYERRHDCGRLQVFGGAELLLSRSYTTNKYSYGNKFSTTNPNPTTSLFNSTGGNYSRISNRVLNSNNDSGFGYGLRTFIGLEYFFLPKISVGGEFGISGIMYTNGINSSNTEFWDFLSKQTSQRYFGANNNRSSIATDNLSGQIILLIYFN